MRNTFRGVQYNFLCSNFSDVLRGPGNEMGRDCSGRGICDYETGTCECFTGYFGKRCQYQVGMPHMLEHTQVFYILLIRHALSMNSGLHIQRDPFIYGYFFIYVCRFVNKKIILLHLELIEWSTTGGVVYSIDLSLSPFANALTFMDFLPAG